MRNLKRIESAGINCPKPILLRQHVLIMEFLGTDGKKKKKKIIKRSK
jgi:RIO kinase 1